MQQNDLIKLTNPILHDVTRDTLYFLLLNHIVKLELKLNTKIGLHTHPNPPQTF